MQSLAVRAHVYRWEPVVQKRLRCRVIRWGEAILETPVSEGVPCDEGRSQSQDRSKVVLLSDVYPKLIRDGPIQRRQRFESLSKDNPCKAA